MTSRKEFIQMAGTTIFLPVLKHVPFSGLWIIGDSILGGQNNKEEYRARKVIQRTVPDWTHIGTIDNEHDCHPGFRTDQVARDITSWVLDIPEPDLVWIYLGVNDILQKSTCELNSIIYTIKNNFPYASILLSRISLFPSYEEECINFNRLIDNFELPSIDYENVFDYNEHFLEDKIHLNDLGQLLLAEKFIYYLATSKL